MPRDRLTTRCRPLLGTFVEITLPGDPKTSEQGFRAIEAVHRAMSFHSEDSDLARLRRAPCGTAVEVSADTVEVLRFANALNKQSAGLFDVTIGAQLCRDGFLPLPAQSGTVDVGGTARDIEIVDFRHIRCHRPLLIDLGGIAKGFAVDRAVECLRAAGVARGMVNAGGDLRVFGIGRWSVGLRDADGTVRDSIKVTNHAVASSSNLHQRRRRFGRVRTPHIGAGRKPVIAGGRVTVVAPRCMLADAMTKIALADPLLAESLLTSQEGLLIRQTPSRLAG